MISALSKLSQRQPIQELAFHKEQWEINGVPFECHESYYQGELLNGVDLRVKSVKGLHNRDRTYDYLQDSQEVVFAASAHLMIYNTHKRTYHQLFSLEGEVRMLKTHLEKMNNHEYILWVESFPSQEDVTVKSTSQRGKKHVKASKRTGSLAQRGQQHTAKAFLKSLFSLAPLEQSGMANSKPQPSPGEENLWHILKVYDYTKKEFVFEGTLQLEVGHTLQDIFIFCNHYRLVGFISEDYESDMRYVHYRDLVPKEKPADGSLFPVETEPPFTSLPTNKYLKGLLFNSELNHMVFFHANTLNVLAIREEDDEKGQELFKQFLLLGSRHEEEEKPKALLLEVEERVVLDEEILCLALNDQYLAVLTPTKIKFYSAFDISSLIFTHTLQGPPEPLNIEFNKSSIMVTHRNSRSIFTYSIKNKTLKLLGETVLQLTHCKEILRVFTNNISSEVFCAVLFYELQTKQIQNYNRDQAGTYAPTIASHLLQGLVEYVMKPAFVDIAAAFLGTGVADATLLGISKRRFRRVHVCPWLSAYVVETEEAVQLGGWRETFENKKCMALHPTGLFLVVCLKQAFRLYLVTREGFVNSYRGDSVKEIQACAISPAGNHLVVCSPNSILIYDFYSCARLRTIALPFGTMIQGVQFSGHTLVCFLRSRKIYLYDSLNEYRETFSFNPKVLAGEGKEREEDGAMGAVLALAVDQVVGMGSSSVYYCPLLNFFIFSQRSTVFFYNCTTQTVHAAVQLEPLSCIHYCANLSTLFLGTQAGELICFAWPNKPHNLLNQQRKFKLHAGRIMDIRVSSDLREVLTIGEDESMSVCSLVLVQNLKRFQGLQLVEQLAGGIRICYDFLGRRGLCQFTHSKFQDKSDSLKDHEDQVLNANFILPEQRQKQKEQMFANVKSNMRNIADGNKDEYDIIANTTNQARDQVAAARHQLANTMSNHRQQKEELKQAMYAEYIRHYTTTETFRKELEQTTIRLQDELQSLREKLRGEAQKAQKDNEKTYSALVDKQEAEMRGWKQDNRAELTEIDQQKREFISANVGALEDVVAEINNNNGVLACKNNNLEKQINDLKRKMEEHRYLLYRLQGNTAKLKEEQARYEGLKADNKRMVEKEDKINLTEIEKRYVKQTQTLIEKDKEINVQLVNHHKEKEILIHLEKCLQGVEGSIQTLVGNILQEKKDRKEEMERIEATRQQAVALMAEMMARKKEKISMRNQFHNYLCRLQAIIEDIMHSRTRTHLIQLLRERELIDKEAVNHPKIHLQDKEILSKILSEKMHTLAGDGRAARGKPNLMRSSGGDRSLRMLKTEANERSSLSSFGQRQLLATTCREVIARREKEVYMKLDAEQKQYQRIKTQQLVFENTRKKFNLENQDLIQNYNSLAIENKRIVHALRRQESLTRTPAHRQRSLRGEGSPTPFQLYLSTKDHQKSRKAFVPLHTFEQL